MAAAGIAVSVSAGVMKPLLEKLTKLMGHEYKKLKGLRKEVNFLMCELPDMNALLERMDNADKLDPQAKIWRKDIIDMSYDIEDYIDDFMSRIGEGGDVVGLLQKASHYLKTFKDRYRQAKQIKKIKAKVIQASDRRKRYMFDQSMFATTPITVDPRLSALYVKSASLVGIDSQKNEIVRWVMDEEQQLKVMSIVGFGGLGKTTLANEVYREVGGKFNCKAFISISQNPDIIKLLNSIMLKLGLQPYSHTCEPQDLINKIIGYLQDMRYFIIVDDLWNIRDWNTISCAFPENNHHSRVMITTRIRDVARTCCGNHGFIHNMMPLSEQDSRKLFFNRIFGPEDACPPDFLEASCKILKKCGGLPLAIITMASMIACHPTRSMEQWAGYIQNSLAFSEFATNPTYEDMMHIIDFSYKHLPHHLKACFLYLGTYPEDHKIKRVELVRRWVAEGFVSRSPRKDVWGIAEDYFCELANRSMIQPVYRDFDKIQAEVTHCRVHDMMLELILRKCVEDNFISLIKSPEMILEGHDKVIRRLTIDLRSDKLCRVTIMANTRHPSRVRSLNIFRGNCRILNLAEFKFMRLLFLDVNKFKTAIDLTGINHLSQLRYLKVNGRHEKVLLPSQIRGLQFLETLDLSELAGSCSSLTEIVDVPSLSHLSTYWLAGRMRLPDGIGKVKSLRSLGTFCLEESSLENIMSVGELTDLRELLFRWGNGKKGVVAMPMAIAALITCLEKLGNLRVLRLLSTKTFCCGDAMLEPIFSPPFYKIEMLYLNQLMFSSVPRWIGHLRCLRELDLQAKHIFQEDINVMGTRLTSLFRLFLRMVHVPTERLVIGCSTGFKVLKLFYFDCDGVSCLTFETGAMPNLQVLRLAIDPEEWDKATPVGLQHLPSLKILGLSVEPVNVFGTAAEEVMTDVFQKAADALPTRPAVEIDEGSRLEEWRVT